MTDRILEVKNLTIDIPVPGGILHAVQSISFQVERGETLCIVGESGCGKSLTSLAIIDLLPQKAIRSADKLELDGLSILGVSERHMSDIRGERMGMIFQEPMTSLNPLTRSVISSKKQCFATVMWVARKLATALCFCWKRLESQLPAAAFHNIRTNFLAVSASV